MAVVDGGTGATLSTMAVGSHPNDMVVTRDGRYLFVAQANDNSVSCIDTGTGAVVEVFLPRFIRNRPREACPMP